MSSAMRCACLLGPQRHKPSLVEAARVLGVDEGAKIATITAGWMEREREDRELDEHFGGRTVNLDLWSRSETVLRRDPELEQALKDRLLLLRELQALYRLRLAHAMAACMQLLHRAGNEVPLRHERAASIEALRVLDEEHLRRVADVHEQFDARWQPVQRPAVAHERRQIEALVRDAGAVAIAGGQVAVLLNRLRLFDIASLLKGATVLAWSAGAMALAERVVLFHNTPPHGPGHTEVFGAGLALAPALLPFPHARHRLRFDDVHRVLLTARRFAPALCVPLDDGERVDLLDGAWSFPAGTRRMGADGSVHVWTGA